MYRLTGSLLAVGLLAAACGGGGGAGSPAPPTLPAATAAAPLTTPTSAAATAPAETAAAATSAAATGSPVAGEATVQLADTELGQILVDGAGMTLYGFVPDEAEGVSTCYDQCAAAWPPLLVEDDFTVGEGLDEADFSTAARTDGGNQLVIGTYPLYYFAADEAAGDVSGQGVNDVWFVVGADGELIRDE